MSFGFYKMKGVNLWDQLFDAGKKKVLHTTIYNFFCNMKKTDMEDKKEVMVILDAEMPQKLCANDSLLRYIVSDKKRSIQPKCIEDSIERICKIAGSNMDLCDKILGRINKNITRVNELKNSDIDGVSAMCPGYLHALNKLRMKVSNIAEQHKNNIETMCSIF